MSVALPQVFVVAKSELRWKSPGDDDDDERQLVCSVDFRDAGLA